MSVADYAFPPLPSVAALRAAGVTGVVRYVAGGSASKHITAAEYKQLRAAGLDVALVWELAETTLRTEFDAAGAARAALSAANALGYTGVIYWAADWDVRASEWPKVRDNLRAVCGVLTVARTGLYSSTDALDWAARDGVARWFWQSMSAAFSGRRNGTPNARAHLWQRRRATIGGADLDLNDIRQSNWGQQQQQEDDVALKDDTIPGTAAGLPADRKADTCLSDLWAGEMLGHSGLNPKDKSYRTLQLERIEAGVTKPAPVTVDAAAVAAALTGDGGFVDTLVDKLADALAARLAS